ncbi:MAG: protein translocase SEC61 complex subunit gamma [Methanoculleaceae archaeon]
MAIQLSDEMLRKYWRIIKLARRPTREEFTRIALVSAAGIVLIGLFGFIIYEIMLLSPK